MDKSKPHVKGQDKLPDASPFSASVLSSSYIPETPAPAGQVNPMIAIANDNNPNKNTQPWKKVKYIIRQLSAGKYTTNFYNNSKSQHASVCGGVVTVILSTFIIINVYLIFLSIFRKD